MKSKSVLIALLGVLCLIYTVGAAAGTNGNLNTTESQMDIKQLILENKKAVDPNDLLKNAETIKVESKANDRLLIFLYKKPDMYYLSDSYSIYVINDKNAWAGNTNAGIEEVSRRELKGFLEDSLCGYLNILSREDINYGELKLDKELSDVGKYKCYKLTAPGKNGEIVSYYVDSENYLIRRIATDSKYVNMDIYDLVYADKDNLKWCGSYKLKVVNKSSGTTVNVPASQNIILNQDIKDSAFDKPQIKYSRYPLDKEIETELKNSSGYTDKLNEKQKLWGLGCCALVTLMNRDDTKVLGGGKRTEKYIAEKKKVLEDWWGLNNREDLLSMLSWLKDEGHRKGFRELAEKLDNMDQKQYQKFKNSIATDAEALNSVQVCYLYRKFLLPKKGIYAWDACRFISLCGWGYIAGYLSEDEAWSLIIPMAETIQKTFDSWQDMGYNYMIGRQYWSSSANTDSAVSGMNQLNFSLLSNPKSIWKQIPWKLSLTVYQRYGHVLK